jgi:histidyl-tRNA synthetase
MYTFVDKGGRSITLRPEYTPSVVRAIIEHRLDLKPEPLRYYFIGPMFRYDKPQKGRYRQFHQVDVEVFNEKDPAIDAEIIEMASAFLSRVGVSGTETLVNSVGCRACRPGYSRALRLEAQRIRDQLCPDCQRKITTNPLRIFDCKVETCREESARFPKIGEFLCGECRTHFDDVLALLDLYGLKYRVDPSLVRGLDYYTKTTFEVVSPGLGAQSSLLGGGRYDDLMKDFGGPDICGIGFALGLERLVSVLALKPEPRRILYLAWLGEAGKRKAIELARFFRRGGVASLVEFGAKSLRNQFARANKLAAAWVCVAGDDEIGRGRFSLKNMSSGTQTEGTPDELLDLIRRESAGPA